MEYVKAMKISKQLLSSIIWMNICDQIEHKKQNIK